MKNKTALLGLSGGVDSAVAALLLQKQGYRVVGAFMRCFSEQKSKLTRECHWIEDKKSAQKVAALINIDLIELNYEKEYTNEVIKSMFKAYAKGITPNPDADCNTIIKFPFLLKEAKKRGIRYVATGHYIKKIQKNKKFYLKIPKDKAKDQSYFLYGIKQKDLKHLLFPIGDYMKVEVRTIAKKNHFPNWDRRGTRGLCFVGNIDMKEFLKQKIRQRPGAILNPEGEIVGTHHGMQFYTIGERIGQEASISDEYRNKIKSKLYVAAKNPRKNELVIAPENHPILYKKQFIIKKINYIAKKPKFPLKSIKVRIRHLGKLLPATITKSKSKIICTLKHPTQGIAQGQSAVIYINSDIMLFGGEIDYI